MSAGLRNRRVAFEALEIRAAAPAPGDADETDPFAVPDGDALGESRVWVPRFSRWCRLRPARGLGEGVDAQALAARGIYDCEALFDSETASIAPETWRARHGDQVFNIVAADDPDGSRRVILMQFRKGEAA